MKRVTGIGGIFFKAEDPEKLKSWYATHLGFEESDYGASIVWLEKDTSNTPRTEWTPFAKDTTYFSPSEKPFMVNFRVENLVTLLAVLREEGVTITGAMEEHAYGKFAWILDPEGNKIELWEPVD